MYSRDVGRPGLGYERWQKEKGKDKRESLKEGWKEVLVEEEGETKALGATDWWITQRQLDIE